MRRILMLLVLAEALLCTGCDKKYKVSDFPLKPGLTEAQVEDVVGSPTRRDVHWFGYALEDGTELRLYFLGGDRNEEKEKRTLTEATIYSGAGVRLKNVYMLHPLKAPSSPTTAPSTAPSIGPAVPLLPTTQP